MILRNALRVRADQPERRIRWLTRGPVEIVLKRQQGSLAEALDVRVHPSLIARQRCGAKPTAP
jgi:hypothetical protein